MLVESLYLLLIYSIQLFITIFSFGKVFKGSKDVEIFNQWAKNVKNLIIEGTEVINQFKDMADKESVTLEEYMILESRLEGLNPESLDGKVFSLKGKDKEEFEQITEEMRLFVDDYTFFLSEIRVKKEKIEKDLRINKEIDSYMTTLAEIESKQQLLARTVPRINTTAELDMVLSELDQLKQILPTKIEINSTLPEDTQIRIERTNIKLNEWNKKLEFIDNSIAKHKGKVESSAQEQEQKQNLSKVHTWLDSSEKRIMKMSDRIKKITEIVNDETSSSKDLVNTLKDLNKLKIEIHEVKPPEIDLIGEKQTKIGIDFRLKELQRLEYTIKDVERSINENISYRIAFIRSSILEKMFLKSHQLSFSQVNYSLGYKNELLLQGWISKSESENIVLKNQQNKYLMLEKEKIGSMKESSEKIFQSLLALTKFECETNEISYNQSIKWLLANDDKWLTK